jgi:hypothetical protein
MQMHQTSRRITERKQEMIGAIDAVCNVAVAASTGISKKSTGLSLGFERRTRSVSDYFPHGGRNALSLRSFRQTARVRPEAYWSLPHRRTYV